MTLAKPKPLTVAFVFKTLEDIAKTSGAQVSALSMVYAYSNVDSVPLLVAKPKSWVHPEDSHVVSGVRNSFHHPIT
jgi:hypothetical protein